MSRLRVRNNDNTKWLDICQSEWYVRNPANTAWQRITPGQGMKARHGSNDYWLDINCLAEGVEDCEEDEYGGTQDGKGANGSGPGLPADSGSGGGSDSGGGTGGDGSGGGGSGGGTGGGSNGPGSINYNNDDLGSGDGGSGWMDGAPYPVGYDLPDSGGDGAGDRGDCIMRPGLNTCEPKITPIARPDKDCGTSPVGSWNCPFECPDSLSGRGRGITEFYVDLGTVSGPVKFPWTASPGAISIDIYYRGKRVATTGGTRSGRDALRFVFSPVNNDGKIFVRIRSKRSDTRWTFQIRCPNDIEDGTIDDPRPCHGTYQPRSGGQGVSEYYHDMGTGSGLVDVHYQMWNQPDKMEVFRDGALIASTNTYVAGEGHLKFNYSPGGSNLIMLRITARDPGTSWNYAITCPGEKGAADDPRACDDSSAVTSGGAGVTDTYINMGTRSGKVGIRYQMWNIPDKMDVYQNGTLVATTGAPVAGDHWLYFEYDPSRGTTIMVRVTGSGKTSWSFLHTCPGEDDPNISVNAPSIREGAAGQNPSLCWTVSMDRPQGAPVTVDYGTNGGSAQPVVAQGRILATDQFDNPFIAVVDQADVGKVAFDGGFPKFYNEAFRPPMPAPSGSEVFNTWYRTAGADLFTSPSQIPSGNEAGAWTYSNGAIVSTVNSSNIITFLSPDEYDSYTFEATLSSPGSDDDMIGLVAAYKRDGNVNKMILAVRHRGGMGNFGTNFSLVLVHNNVVQTIFGGKNSGPSPNTWGGAQTRVRVERDCGKLTAYCSPFGSLTIDPSTKVEIDLDALFMPTSRWGFCAQSQETATFGNIFLSGIGLPPQFTYLKNLILWSARPGGNKRILVTSDQATGNIYSLDTAANGFHTSMKGTVEAAGYTAVINDIYAWNNVGVIPLSDLKLYDVIIMIGSRSEGGPQFQAATVANFGEYVKSGGGLILITDHDVFQASINQLASLFNVEFYASVDRAPISVADTIVKHGDHPAWDGLSCKMLPAGGSEGAIRLKQVEPDYRPTAGTVTFAPGETSKEVCVPIIGNDKQQPDRTINMNISNPSRGKITKPTGVGTIIDDDSALCKQNPTGVVYQRAGGPDGSYLLHVQPDFNCAAGNVKYLMMANLNFAYSGPYVFTLENDDDFELYIDCKLVASGPIGRRSVTINVAAGTRNIILRYLNIPNCTPGYAGFSVRFNNVVTYLTKASDWKGQVNSVGEIESGNEPAPSPTPVVPPTCNSTPEICQVYQELFNRLPDEAGAQYWLSEINANGWDVKTPTGYAAFKERVRASAGQSDCIYMGGTWDAANNRCILP